MKKIDPFQLDLNLLKAFDALARERSVTRAAERLGIGQPAMSHALNRLREVLDDELFVRNAAGMEPTKRALSLVQPIRNALDQLAEALSSGNSFDPAVDKRQFRLGMVDWIAAETLTKLLGLVIAQAPNVSVSVRTIDGDRYRDLVDDGSVDLAVGRHSPVASWQKNEVLFSERHVCVFNEKLVQASDPITIDEYVKPGHVLVSHSGEAHGLVDDALAKLHRTRRVIMSGTQFLLAPYLLHDLPIIATLPKRFAASCSALSGLRISPLPFPMESFQVSMLWHLRNDREPGHIWLRQFLSRHLIH